MRLFIYTTSGYRTPGNRSCDLLDTWADCLQPPARTPPSFKALGCSYNCRRLTGSSFQLMYMSHDEYAVQLTRGSHIVSHQPIEKYLFIPTSYASHPNIGKYIHQMVSSRKTLFLLPSTLARGSELRIYSHKVRMYVRPYFC